MSPLSKHPLNPGGYGTKKISQYQQEQKYPNKGRRNFIKQSSMLTALAVTPPCLVKAAESEWDKKAAVFFEQVPLPLK